MTIGWDQLQTALGASKYRLLEDRIAVMRRRDKDREARKVCDEVFDHETLLAIYWLISHRILTTLDFPISTGKEGNVFKATAGAKAVAVKIYRVTNATFNTIARYIIGDPRFSGISGKRRKIIYAWAQKEYSNLFRMYHDAKVRVPEPITFEKNILVMEYIGTATGPAPLMRNVRLREPQRAFETIIKYIERCYRKAGLVHGDLSEYNVLVRERRNKEELVLIDVGQGMLTTHPMALELLRRDIRNICRYFRGLGIENDENRIFDRIAGARANLCCM